MLIQLGETYFLRNDVPFHGDIITEDLGELCTCIRSRFGKEFDCVRVIIDDVRVHIHSCHQVGYFLVNGTVSDVIIIFDIHYWNASD